jgi:hypothetical protein
MKIVGSSFCAGDGQGQDAGGFDGDDIVLILQLALDEQELLVDDDHMVSREELRRDDGIGDAGFVLEAQKNKTLRGPRALAGDHGAGNPDMSPVGEFGQLDGGANALALQCGAMVGHGMRANRHPGAAKIGGEAFFGSHRGEWRECRNIEPQRRRGRRGSAEGCFGRSG